LDGRKNQNQGACGGDGGRALEPGKEGKPNMAGWLLALSLLVLPLSMHVERNQEEGKKIRDGT
jgi:hypothetical protein